MKFKVLVSTCLLSLVLASCSSSNSDPDSNTDGTTDGAMDGTTDSSTGGDPFEGSTDSTTDPATTDGSYAIDVEIYPDNGPECEETVGQMMVSNNVITGTVVNPSDITDLEITGTINADGSISGGFALSGGASYATYTGNVLSTGDLEGEWIDEFGCSGPWTAIKSQ